MTPQQLLEDGKRIFDSIQHGISAAYVYEPDTGTRFDVIFTANIWRFNNQNGNHADFLPRGRNLVTVVNFKVGFHFRLGVFTDPGYVGEKLNMGAVDAESMAMLMYAVQADAKLEQIERAMRQNVSR